ncbi:MAG: response regulator [Chloroflexi bacterium]|nr:MAG: response regulator [Chloroflexota bacterium]
MSKRVLYIEDNPRNMLLVQRIVEAEGHEFIGAVDGESGWKTAVSAHPDLILMDLRLPGEITGFELTRRIRQHEPLHHTPIIAVTAYGSDEAEKRARAAGCDGFLCKPADIRQIQALLREYLGQKPAIKQTAPEAAKVSYVFL